MQRIHLCDHLARCWLVCLCLVLAACGGGGGSSSGGGNDPSPKGLALSAQSLQSAVTLDWNDTDTGESHYNLFYSTSPDCDIHNYATCPGGTMVEDVTHPYTVAGLENNQNYWFFLEAVDSDRSRLSNVAGARPARLMTNGRVDHLLVDDNDSVYLTGDFDQMGLYSGRVRSFDLKTGLAGAFPHVVGGNVEAVVSDGEGGVFIGGSFTRVDGEPHANLAHIRADGTLSDWTPELTTDSYAVKINGLVMIGDTLYVGGDFNQINGQSREHIAAFSSDGSLLDWSPVLDKGVYTLMARGDHLYVGGAFTSIDGKPRSKVAIFGLDGELTDWTPPMVDGSVSSLAVTDKVIYLGGTFDSIDEAPRGLLAALDLADGSLKDWAPVVDSNFTRHLSVDALAVSDNTLYVGGFFSHINGLERTNIAAFDLASGQVKNWNPGVVYSAGALGTTVSAISVVDNTVYIGGKFSVVNGEIRYNLAAFSSNGALRASTPNVGNDVGDPVDSVVYALAVDGDTVYAAGGFLLADVKKRERFAAVDSDARLLEFEQLREMGGGGPMALSGDTLYVTSSGHPFNAVAINLNGEASDFSEITGSMSAVAIADDTLLLAASGPSVIRVDGEVEGDFVATDLDGTVRYAHKVEGGSILAITSDGDTVYVGGSFTSVGNGEEAQERNGLAAFDLATGELKAWNPGTTLAEGMGTVYDLAMAGSTLYVGGYFDQIAGQPRSNAAAFGPEGLLDWQPDLNNRVRALAVQNETVYLGGHFTQVGEENRKYLVAMDTDGALLAWDPEATNTVHDLQVTDHAVHVGGRFFNLGGEMSPYFGRVPLAQDQSDNP